MRRLKRFGSVAIGFLICPLVTLMYLEIRWRTRHLRAAPAERPTFPKVDNAGPLAPPFDRRTEWPGGPYYRA